MQTIPGDLPAPSKTPTATVICEYCSKAISRSNMSKHMRARHKYKALLLKRGKRAKLDALVRLENV
jgi:hypothetical protein